MSVKVYNHFCRIIPKFAQCFLARSGIAYKNLAIFEKTYEFTLWVFPRVNKFPKSQRFVLGQQLENVTLEILEGIIEVNQKERKLVYLKQISLKLDVLRILVRLSKDLKFISLRQYLFASNRLNEIGKMLGGWIRSSR